MPFIWRVRFWYVRTYNYSIMLPVQASVNTGCVCSFTDLSTVDGQNSCTHKEVKGEAKVDARTLGADLST